MKLHMLMNEFQSCVEIMFSLCSWPCHYVHWREDGSRWEIYLCWKCMGNYSHTYELECFLV